MGLNLEGLRESAKGIKAQEEEEEVGQDVKCLLKMPNGEEKMETFKMGTMVSYVKAYIQNKYGYPMAKMTLRLSDGSVMIDPLSLCDIRGLDMKAVNPITVAVDE